MDTSHERRRIDRLPTWRRAQPVAAAARVCIKRGIVVNAIAWFVLLAATACGRPAFAAPPQVIGEWRGYAGIAGERVAADVIGDFDGDGRNEVVSNALLESPGLVDTTRLIVSGTQGANPWAILGDTAFPGRLYGEPRRVARAAGDALVLRVVVAHGPGVGFHTQVYSGVPLQLEDSSPSAGAWLLDVDDFDGDGDEDALQTLPAPPPSTGWMLQVSDLHSGAVAWSAAVSWGTSTAAAQLDADDALEIVVDGTPGEVRDGATGALEWSYAEGFEMPLLGNIDADPDTTELLVHTGTVIRIFQTAPFSPTSDLIVGFGVRATQLADFDHDGVMDVVLGSNLGFDILDLVAGSSRHLPLVAPSGTFASVDGDDDLELVEPGPYFGGDGPLLQIFDAHDGSLEATIAGAPGGATAIGMADLDGDGRDEVVTLLRSGDGATATLGIRDAATGVLLREALLPVLQGAHSSNLAIASIDGDDALEIVVAMGHHFGGRLFAIDGVTLDLQWSINPQEPQLRSVMLREVRIADVDLDGQAEIVALSSQMRVHVLDASSGEPEWQAIGLDTNGNQSIAVAQTDHDPALEIVVWNGQALEAYDGQTRLPDWSQVVVPGSARMQLDSDGERCRFIRYDDSGAIATADCMDRLFVPALPLPGAIDYLAPIDAGVDLVASIGRSLLHVDARSGRTTTLVDSWSPLTAGAVSGVAVADLGEGRVRVVLGRDGVISSRMLYSDGIFFSGFE
jgi:hypothetical protein